MADRMDDDHGSPIGGLSIWVGLASFFSNSSDRRQAQEALKTAREAKKLEKENKEREAGGGEKGKAGSSSRKFGSWFQSKKAADTAKPGLE
jgi:hypothetical protein